MIVRSINCDTKSPGRLHAQQRAGHLQLVIWSGVPARRAPPCRSPVVDSLPARGVKRPCRSQLSQRARHRLHLYMAEYTHGRGYNLGMNAGREPEWEMPQQLAGDAVLSQAQVASFHQRRFIALDGVFPEELLAAHLTIHASHFPEPGPGLDATQVPTASIQFPFAADEMTANLVTLHPNVLTAVSQLLGTTDIRLTRSNLSQKYGVGVHQPGADASSGDQGMHKGT